MKQSLWDLKPRLFSKILTLSTILKQSLWDLKLYEVVGWGREEENFEAVPMGFETDFANSLSGDGSDFEAVPMGFETIQTPFSSLNLAPF